MTRCYNRLAENPRARIALRENLPIILKEQRLIENLDDSSKKCLKNLNEAIFSDIGTNSAIDNDLVLQNPQNLDPLKQNKIGGVDAF